MSRVELSEAAGISESHLKKIEAGVRQPGIQTYQRMIAVLEADVVLKDMTGSIKGIRYFWYRFWNLWHRA